MIQHVLLQRRGGGEDGGAEVAAHGATAFKGVLDEVALQTQRRVQRRLAQQALVDRPFVQEMRRHVGLDLCLRCKAFLALDALIRARGKSLLWFRFEFFLNLNLDWAFG